jgi:hypothetical protein
MSKRESMGTQGRKPVSNSLLGAYFDSLVAAPITF